MALSAGTLSGRQIGSYKITSLLGAGGMGEVYRAHDTTLGRDVAIKLLPPSFALDPERVARFEREAQILAALNHPHIGAIYGVEDADPSPGSGQAAVRALVLELVEGDTLADRIRRGPVRVSEALTIARQIADALDAAHEKGIVHRDLKPANIKITPDGVVKVLDFGLAKAMAADAASSDLTRLPTVTMGGTKEGMILGTTAYMSPEQARGQAVDRRTDIWAFGCVLYEMLAGHAAFPGHTISDTIAVILEREPDWEALPEHLSQSVRRLLQRCLEKDAKKRLRDIGDARSDVEDALARPAQADLVPQRPTGITRRTAISALAGATVGAAATAAVGISRWGGSTPRHVTRIPISLPEGVTAEASFNRRVAISPDGTRVAYNAGVQGQNRVYLRSLGVLESQVLPIQGNSPFFSPNGRWLGFFGPAGSQVYQLRKLGIGGGAPVSLCATESHTGASWSDDDTIYFGATNPGGVLRIPAAGGQPQEAAKIDFAKGERTHKFPCVVPGAHAVLFTVSTADAETFDDTRIVGIDTKTGQRKILVEGGTHPRYSPSGHLVYARGGNLLAVRFDSTRLAISGQPFTVLEGVLMSLNSGAANFDISVSGDLIYVPGVADRGERTLVWVDRHGKADPLALPARSYLHPRISPDSRQLAIEIEGPNHDFYTYDFARAVLTKMTTDGESHWPVWSPDGAHVAYRSGHMAAFRMWRMPADRSRSAEQLAGIGVSQNAESWSPDGHTIAYTAATPETGSHIMVSSLEDHESRSFADIKAPAGSAKFSPDGRWLAYCSNESGKAQVYVQAFPGPGAKIQVSNDGGTDPVWIRAGGELCFRNGDKMMAVSVSTAPAFEARRPQMLWEGRYSHGMSASCGPAGATSSNYDVTADGRRFLMIKDEAPDTANSRQLVVALGWADELTRASGTV